MSRRNKVVGAGALLVIGVFTFVMSFAEKGALNAAGLNDIGLDITKILVWIGVVALVASALLFMSASAE